MLASFLWREAGERKYFRNRCVLTGASTCSGACACTSLRQARLDTASPYAARSPFCCDAACVNEHVVGFGGAYGRWRTFFMAHHISIWYGPPATPPPGTARRPPHLALDGVRRLDAASRHPLTLSTGEHVMAPSCASAPIHDTRRRRFVVASSEPSMPVYLYGGVLRR